MKPGAGLGDLEFGMTGEEVKKILGSPQETDRDEDEFITELWLYPEHGITVFLDMENGPVLISIETTHPGTVLFGEKVFGFNEEQLTALMQKNNAGEQDAEDEAWGERRISYDDLMTDFYFAGGKLASVNIGLLADEDED